MPSMLTSFSEKLHNSALSYYTPVVFDKIPVNSPFTEHVLFCKIVKESACCSIKRSFIVVDPSGTFFVLNVLNLSAEDKSFLRASDELAILDPVRISIKFSFKQVRPISIYYFC
jgi:hypothetical protein